VRVGATSDLLGILVADPLCKSDPDRVRLIQASLARGECVVAVESGKILGYVALNNSFFGQAFVPLLVVAMPNRRAGIGTQLLAEAETRCSREKLFATTNESNIPAQRLFARCGFVASGRIENLDETDDELVYCKWLQRGA
jgi:ribosomal protein S18 acetylase RimI-like enzyme